MIETPTEFRRVTDANPSDSEKLVDLFAQCPMEADISLLIERAPDFFALCRARGTGYTVVAESGSTITGCVSVAHRTVWIRGLPQEVAYVADLRVAPTCRRGGLARMLIQHVAQVAENDPARPYIFATATGNAKVDAVVQHVARHFAIEPISDIASFELFPLIRMRVARGIEIAPAEEPDRAELARFFDDFAAPYNLCPVMGDGGLQEVLSRSPGMSLADYWVARRRGRMVAALCSWDAHQVKQTRVMRMPIALRTFAGTVRSLSRLLPLPSLPGTGDLLRIRYIRQFAVVEDDIEALGALVRSTLNDVRARGEHMVLFSCSKGDPIQRCLDGIGKAKYHYRLQHAVVPSQVSPHLSPDRFYHDDAALA